MSTIKITVTRYNPETSSEPFTQSYTIPYKEDMVVLDALNYIKNHVDGTLTHRWSCRMGVCGSCGMMINGDAKLSCATFLRDYYPGEVQVDPLAHFPVPWIIRSEEKPLEEGEYLQSPDELDLYRQFSMCINCMLCYSACPVYGHDKSFLGPAAIALAHRYNMDSRDEGQDQRAEIIGSHEGIWECTFVGECTRVCPEHVDPAAAIQRTKVQLTKEYFISWLWPWGNR